MVHTILLVAIGVAVGQIPAVAIWAKARLSKVEAQAPAVVAAVKAEVEKKI